jgi:hypothetical protein
MALRLTARLALVATYHRKRSEKPQARQRHGVGCLAHIIDAELHLHERDDLPVVEVREN